MTALRVLPLVLTTLGLAACTGGIPTPSPTVQTTSSTAVVSPSPSVAYRYADLDLCAVTDLAPLAELKLTVQEQRRKPPSGYAAGEAELCVYRLKPASGDFALFIVDAIPAASEDKARSKYAAMEKDSMTADGVVAGPWEQGAARTKNSVSGGYHESQYLIHALSGNLNIAVSLTMYGSAYTPKETLAPSVKAVAETTYATVTRAWKQ